MITLEYKDANLAFQLGEIEGKELNLIKEHLQSTLALRTPRLTDTPIIRTAAKSRSKNILQTFD